MLLRESLDLWILLSYCLPPAAPGDQLQCLANHAAAMHGMCWCKVDCHRMLINLPETNVIEPLCQAPGIASITMICKAFKGMGADLMVVRVVISRPDAVQSSLESTAAPCQRKQHGFSSHAFRNGCRDLRKVQISDCSSSTHGSRPLLRVQFNSERPQGQLEPPGRAPAPPLTETWPVGSRSFQPIPLVSNPAVGRLENLSIC